MTQLSLWLAVLSLGLARGLRGPRVVPPRGFLAVRAPLGYGGGGLTRWAAEEPAESDEAETQEEASAFQVPPGASKEAGREADALLDEMVRKLTEDKERLAAKGDLEGAMGVRDRLRRMQVEDGARVMAQNAEFYRAFSTRDMVSMKDIWDKAEDVSCIHPGQKMKTGYRSVIRAWEGMFREDRQRQPEPHAIRPGNVRVYVRGTTAVVTCTENIFRREPKTPVLAVLHSTNIFRRSHGNWFLVHHHASSVTETASGRQRLPSMDTPGFGMGQPIQFRLGENMDINSIREIIRNKLENAGGFDDGARIIAINGEDMDDDDDDDDGRPRDLDDLASVISQKVNDSLSRKLGKRLDRKGASLDAALGIDDGEDEVAAALGAETPALGGMDDEDLRKETVALIRRMSSPEEGRLTMRQKHLLLGDVIRAAASQPQRKSLVETAYSVLMLESEPAQGDAALDDFAEQCVMLAEALEGDP